MRKLAVFAGAFSAGIFLAQYLLPSDWQLFGACFCLLLGCAAAGLPRPLRRRCVVIGAAMALGLGYHWLYVRQVQRPMLALVDTERPAVMTICEYPRPTDYGAKAIVQLSGFTLGRAVLYGDETLLELVPGQTVSGQVRLGDAGTIRDTQVTTYVSKGVFLLAYSRGTLLVGEGSAASPRWWPLRLGHAIERSIQTVFQGDTAGFLIAILTGERTGLSEEALSHLSEAGLYHMMAVSGMHCGFLLLLFTHLLGKHRRRLLAFCGIPLLIFYAALAGGRPSVVRACVMWSFLLAAPLFRRDSDPPTAMTAALFLILLQNPFAAASVSLQLSFAAVAGILWLTPKLYSFLIRERKRGRVFHWTASMFSATMGALVFTTPLSAWYFGLLVLVSPLSNLLCLPVAAWIFMLGLPTALLGLICPWLAWLPGLVLRGLIWYILQAASLLSAIPYHALYYVNPYLKYWTAYIYLLFAAAYFLKEKTRRKYAIATVLAVFSLIITAALGQLRFCSDLDALVLDVGQGQSVLLASDGEFALVDCGSGNSWYTPGDIAADHLLTMGCRSLDYLILTHYDFDHVCGVTGLMCRMPVEVLLVPEGSDDAGLREVVLNAAERYGTEVAYITEPRTLALGRAEVIVCQPMEEGTDNQRSLAILASAGENDLLITGDMDLSAEARLLEAYSFPKLEVLVAGHHGSKYATGDQLLDALQPDLVCISVGSNAYGHPTEEVLTRLALHGCGVYRTDLQGSVHFSFNKGASSWHTRRRPQRKARPCRN